MNPLKTARALLVGLGLWGLIGPAPAVSAALPTVATRAGQSPPGPARPTSDVELGPGGVLWGQVVGLGGVRLAGVRVVLRQRGSQLAKARTNRHGWFAFADLAGGLYLVAADTPEGPLWQLCRLWTASAAPPQARPTLLLTVGRPTVRAQWPYVVVNPSRAAAVAAALAGAIAAPIIYHNVKSDDFIPASP